MKVIGTVEENVKDVVAQIKSAKAKGKHKVQIKVYQAEEKNGHPSNIVMKFGLVENGEGVKQLSKMGYEVSFIRTDKQVTARYGNGALKSVKVKPLHTTSILVKW